MKTKDTPVKIGVEVESHRPDSFDGYEYDDATIRGWDAGYDCELEFRFRGPADTLRDAFDRCDALGEYMASAGYHSKLFGGQGTHVHLGVLQWLLDNFKTNDRSSKEAGLLYGYFITRHLALWKIIPSWREDFTYCRHVTAPTALYSLHNYLVRRGTESYRDRDYPAVAAFRRGHPTFEVRMFPGTNNLNVVKGYIAILVSMMKGAEKAMLDLDWRTAHVIPDDKAHLPLSTSNILADQRTYTIADLKREVTSVGFQVDPLLDWIDRTQKKRGRLESFFPDMSELPNTQAQPAPQSLRVAA